MAAPTEVLITSDESGQLWNSCVWDLHTGTVQTTYKGGASASKTLSLIHQDYIISAEKKKPLLHVWSLGSKSQMQLRMTCSDVVSALAISPDGYFCVAGIGDKIHIWNVTDGNLLCILSRHYQPVSCLKFSDDGLHFVSAGKDSLVLVWSLPRILQKSGDILMTKENEAPLHVLSGHSLPVTDVHIGVGGMKARIVSCSMDQTCKIYELASGQLLLSVHFEVALSSVLMDSAEFFLYVGCVDGRILQIPLFSLVCQKDKHVTDDEMRDNLLEGHKKEVRCLAVSSDGHTVVSGSKDETVRIWDAHSHQCVRVLQHKAPITNLILTLKPASINQENFKPQLPIQPFKRHFVDYSEENEGLVSVNLHTQKIMEEESISFAQHNSTGENEGTKSREELSKDLETIKEINRQLFSYCTEYVMKG